MATLASQDYEEKGIELFDDVVKIYAQAEQEMLAKVAKRVKKGATDTGWNEIKLDDVQSMNKQIDAILTSAQTKVMNKVSSHAKAEYMKAADIQFDEGISDYVKDSVRVTSEYMSKNFNTMIKRVTQDENDFKGLNSGAMMYIDPKDTSVLHINPAKFKDKSVAQINEMLKAQEGKYHKNMDMKSLVMHEYGHVVAVNKNLGPTMDKLLSEFVKSDKFNDFVKSLSPDERMMLPYLDDSQKVAKMVSYYAGTSKDELFAEAFADYYKNGENASEFAKMLGKEVEEISKKEVEEAVKKRQAAQTFKQMMNDAEIPMNLQQLLLATNNLLTNAKFQVLRNADDAYRQIQANASTALLSGVDTRIGVSQRMLNEFAQKGITTFVDKSGRHWDLGSYAEMCARTVSSHAALQGHIQRQEEVGEDLVKVSSIGTTCPICMPWQGVVLSISGKSPKYHSLDEAKSAGLFHPNCKHTLLMYIPELDDGTENEGKVEPSPVDVTSKSFVRNKLIEQQRSNERNIRYWKKRMSMAITPEDKEKARQKVKYWQQTNMLFCEKNGLRRQYARENSLRPNKLGKTGAFIGGSKFEFEELYKDVVGVSSQTVFKAIDLSGKRYDSWLRDEIVSLDQLDIDKAQMKDASYKSVTPTSLYKKYIGDSPLADWAAVSPYEKGTKEYKSGYAKWLKMQIDEIGVSYKIKPKYTEVHEDIPIEDTKLSATEIYKKYHDGKKPTVAYSEAGGEEGTGMKYGKWVETEKKKLIKEGITKTVPFDSSTMEKTRTVIKEAKKVVEEAEKFVEEPELVAYKEMLKKTKTEPKAISTEMKLISDKIKTATGFEKTLLEKKYEAVKEHDLDVLREKVKTAKHGSGSGDVDFEMKWLKEHVLDSKTIPDEVKAHVKKKYDIWAERKVELDKEEAEKKRKEAERLAKEEKKRRAIKSFKDIAEKISNEDIEAMKKLTIKDDDEFRDEKIKALDEIIKERTKAAEDRRIAAEAAERRKKMLEDREKYLAEMGVLPRDKGAAILDDLSGYYDSTLRSSAKKRAQSTIDDIAKELSITSEQAKEELNNDLKAMLMECEYGARIKGSVLKKVLSDNPNIRGFKNLFEVGTGGGCTDQYARGGGEDRVFGYKESFRKNKLDRPFYGMLMPKYDEKSKKYYQSGPGSWYGDGITLTFNKALTNNISFTIGDSLDYDDYVTGCEASNPEFRGCHRMFESKYVAAKKSGVTSPSELLMRIADGGDRYLELQYHGHETKMSMVDYIDKVYIKGSRPDIEKLLDEKGIPYEII